MQFSVAVAITNFSTSPPLRLGSIVFRIEKQKCCFTIEEVLSALLYKDDE
jgi:hypothetical protein